MDIHAYVVDHVDAPFRWEELTVDEPGPGEAVVRIVATGLCHTDLNTQAGNMPLPLPGVLGHEGAGIVTKIGAGVENVAVGDHVVIGWPFCGTCRNCIRGEHRYCLHTGELLTGGHRVEGPHAGESAYTRKDGSSVSGHFFGQSSFADYSLVTASQLVVVDESVPLELVGPLACGITTGAGAVFNTANPGPGESVVVYGVGAVGLGAIMAARNSAAATIIAVDLHDSRLELAQRYGATHTINSGKEDSLERIREITGGAAVNVLGKRLSRSVQRQAITVVVLATGAVIGGTMLIMLTDTGLGLDRVLFESVSAFATVGLSTGITPTLAPFAQWVLIALMFMGRLGPVTVAAAIAFGRRPPRYELPKERPLIG